MMAGLVWDVLLFVGILGTATVSQVTVEDVSLQPSASSPPPCQFKSKRALTSPNFFAIPSQGNLEMERVTFNVSSAGACSFDVAEIFADHPDDVFLVYFIKIRCLQRGQIVLVNPSGLQAPQIIAYLAMLECDIYWSDLAVFGAAVDLRVLYLINWNDRYDEEKERFLQLSPGRIQGLRQLPLGLQNIGSFWIVNNLSAGQLPRLLTEFFWPRMAEVVFEGMRRFELPEELQITMPNLQAIEMKNITMTATPTHFPWDPNTLHLPLNLSRTPNGNHHYTVSLGFYTPPHLYRRVLQLEDSNITDLTGLVFQGHLQKISLAHNKIQEVTAETFNSMSLLQSLDLSYNLIKKLHNGAFAKLVNLTSLILHHNQIDSISQEVLAGLQSVQSLDLSHNLLSTIPEGTFYPLKSMLKLDFSNNLLKQISNRAVHFEAEKLVEALLPGNQLSLVPHWLFMVRSLQTISLQRNQITFESFVDSFQGLDETHIRFNNQWSASQTSLVTRPALTKTVDMTHNNITTIDREAMDLHARQVCETIMFFFNLQLDKDTLVCDCHMYSFYTFLQKQALTSRRYNHFPHEEWVCALPASVAGMPIVKVANTTFKCSQPLPDCPQGCDCQERSVDHVIEVNCSARGLRTLPEYLPVNSKQLLLEHNHIQKLTTVPAYLKNLTVLNLSYNNISTVSETFIQALDGVQEITLDHNKLMTLPRSVDTLEFDSISLTMNRWMCDCNNVWFKQWLLQHRHSVSDIDQVTCAVGRGQGTVYIEIPESDFICEVPAAVVVTRATVGFSAAFLVLLLFCLLLYRYRGEIKVYLYVHYKWHPFDRSEHTDVDFDFDAFISYAGDDYKWVVFQLVARLEGMSPPFKLCLHDRDFEVGAPIQHNIMQSVRRSRRMVMVLSRRYLQSEWCMLEFRAAHERVLNDRSNYLILVLFDDVSVDELEDDMQLYIRTNTYLSISNKWFWEKLEYAMPHTRLSQLRDDITFEFPYLTAPPSSYPDYLLGYMAKHSDKYQEELAKVDDSKDAPMEVTTM